MMNTPNNSETLPLKYLKDSEEHVNIHSDKDEDGWEPIHFAAFGGHLDIIQNLLENGAQADVRDNDGTQPIHYAAVVGNTEVVKKLVSFGASAEAKTKFGTQPMHLSALRGHIETMKALIDLGASPTCEDNNGYQPIHNAARDGNVDTLKFLLKLGADKEAEDKVGNKPLALAAHYSKMKATEFLLSEGANINSLQTALHTNTEKILNFVSEQYDRNPVKLSKFIGKGKTSFICKKENNETLLQHILNNYHTQESETVINLLEKTLRDRGCEDTRFLEEKIINQLKVATDTNHGLVKAITTTQSRYPWSTPRIMSLTLLNILIAMNGVLAYIFDVYTDIQFR